MACRPDLTTLRLVPWLEGTALVVCDLFDLESGSPVEVVTPPDPPTPDRARRRRGLRRHDRVELEFFVFRESYDEAAARGYRDLTPQNDYVLDYHILQTTKDEYLIRAIRNGMDAAGIPVEFSKGEAEAGQHEINLRYADALDDGRPPCRLQERSEGDRRAPRAVGLVHGEVRHRPRGLVVPHPLVAVAHDGDGSAMPDASGAARHERHRRGGGSEG